MFSSFFCLLDGLLLDVVQLFSKRGNKHIVDN